MRDPADLPARQDLALAATYAGLGIGSAGVHIPHANAYPIAGRVREYRPPDYPADAAIVPHGMAVALTAPTAFRFTFKATPQRHLHAAHLLEPDATEDGADLLPAVVLRLMRDVGMPSGLAEVGYDESDVPDLVAGAMQQQRLLSISPRAATEGDLARIFGDSLELW
jgi:alcohol dehydrogenase class IV